MRSITRVSNNLPNTRSNYRLAREGRFWDACNMAFKIKQLPNVVSGGALSSAVEHYLHTIKRAFLAIFSYLFLTVIFIANGLIETCYTKTMSGLICAYKIPNFRIGLQVGCKFFK
jgi:hypothetical protein